MTGRVRWLMSASIVRGIARRFLLQPPAPVPSSLLQQRADLVQVLALVAGLVAAVHVANVALAIDEHRARHRAHVVELTHLTVSVEQDRERYRRLLKPALRILRVL